MAASLQITDGIDGPVLLDLSGRDPSGTGFYLGDRASIDLTGIAQVQRDADRTVVWGAGVGPTGLTNRTIKVPLVARGGDPSMLPGLIARLHQQVRRPWWLRVLRHGATVPIWLRCYPTVPTVGSDPTGAAAAVTRVTIEADTDPYAYGQRVDVPLPVIPQDPATPNAYAFTIGDVQGDSHTPLVLSTDDREILASDTATLVTVRHRGDPAALGPLWLQAETATLSASTSNPPTVATFSGDSAFSGGAGAGITFAAGSAANVPWGAATFSAPLSGPEAIGLYRVLVRARRSGAAAGAQINFRVMSGDHAVDTVWGASESDFRVVDCGVTPVPAGMPMFQSSPASMRAATASPLRVMVFRGTTGAGRVDLDWVALVPSDEGCAVLWADGDTSPAGSWLSVDGFDHTPRLFDGFPFAAGARAVGPNSGAITRVTGAMPMLAPGMNRVWLVGGLSTVSGSSWSLARSVTGVVSYWPRWSWLT